MMGNAMSLHSAPMESVQWEKQKAKAGSKKSLMAGGDRKPTGTRDMVCLEVGARRPWGLSMSQRKG